MSKIPLKDVINRYRRNILIHSCIYYRLSTSVVSDYEFDRWCRRLVELQEKYPEIAEQCDYHEAFKDFDGSTGYDLPIGTPDIVSKARYVIKLAKEKRGG